MRGKAIKVDNYRESLSHQKIPKIAAPTYKSWGELLTFLQKENLPGAYPYTGGVYPYRRTGEDPTACSPAKARPSAPTAASITSASASRPRACRPRSTRSRCTAKTRRRARTSTARSATPASTSPTLDDMKKLYSGFDLCAPTTSVSMTINGPAPMILAMFMNTAIDQQVEKYLREDQSRWDAAHDEDRRSCSKAASARTTAAMLPDGQRRLGLGLLGVTGDQVVDAETYARIKARDAVAPCAAPCRPTS